MIPQNIIEDIKFRNDIEDVISGYVTLKRAGSNMNGLCPFHSEKTPSFTVFTSSQNYYCFGCGAGGDVINFIMRIENLDYPSAIEFLARRVGITLPVNNNFSETGVKRSRVLEMNKTAARFFRDMLFNERIGGMAMSYLVSERKLPMAIIKRFGLGYAPNSFELLRNHLVSAGFTEEEMTAGFLCGISKKNGKPFDYFRNRVMFPIIDVSGNVIAFGGRVMDDSTPKYLNSSDTPAFKKSRNLFALNYAKSYCSDVMILCEGYMDVIALHSAGFQNAVATLGTAITSEQARLIAKYTKKVIISYDGDDAGIRAADKAMKLLEEVGVEVRILRMSGAKDPDEYIKKFGRERFERLLNDSRTRFDYRFDSIISKYDISIPDEKIKASSEFCEVIAGYYSAVERDVYIGRVSQELGISAELIKSDVNKIIRRRSKENKETEQKEIFREISRINDRINPESASKIRIANAEEALLGIIMLRGDNISEAIKNEITEDCFFTDFNRKVFNSILNMFKLHGHFDISMLEGEYSPDEISRLVKIQLSRQRLAENGEEQVKELASILKNESEHVNNTNNISDIIELKRKKQNT